MTPAVRILFSMHNCKSSFRVNFSTLVSSISPNSAVYNLNSTIVVHTSTLASCQPARLDTLSTARASSSASFKQCAELLSKDLLQIHTCSVSFTTLPAPHQKDSLTTSSCSARCIFSLKLPLIPAASSPTSNTANSEYTKTTKLELVFNRPCRPRVPTPVVIQKHPFLFTCRDTSNKTNDSAKKKSAPMPPLYKLVPRLFQLLPRLHNTICEEVCPGAVSKRKRALRASCGAGPSHITLPCNKQ